MLLWCAGLLGGLACSSGGGGGLPAGDTADGDGDTADVGETPPDASADGAADAAADGRGHPRCPDDSADLVRPAHWTVASHCPGAEPDYDEVFSDGVRRFGIAIAAADHTASFEDLDEIVAGGSPSGDLDALPTPLWVPATVTSNGLTWTEVGMRYKGHSSLKAAWQSGIRKLSFVLDFDRYEDAHQDLTNQRFFGFKRLTFSNGFNDPSLLREKVAAEVFRASGVPAARSTFAAVWLDWGQGPVYLGLYTLVEDPCDAMMKSQFGAGGGQLYKPWGDAARWQSPSEPGLADVAATFDTCASDDPSDRADVMAAIAALHADSSDPASWRAGLEAVFDVEAFLRVLAVNQVLMNWDSYGCMHHNYFVYASPRDAGRFVWFPWDLNEAMLDRHQAGCPPPGSVMLDEIVFADASDPDAAVDANWPLIRLLLADPEYRATYRTNLRAALAGPFAAETVLARMRTLHTLIAPFVVGPEATEAYPYTAGAADGFATSLTGSLHALEPHVAARHEAVTAALAAE